MLENHYRVALGEFTAYYDDNFFEINVRLKRWPDFRVNFQPSRGGGGNCSCF